MSSGEPGTVFLLRRNGSIAWRASGLRYKNEFGFPFAMLLGMKVHVQVCDVEFAYRALESGDYMAAAKIFSGPFLPGDRDVGCFRRECKILPLRGPPLSPHFGGTQAVQRFPMFSASDV